MTRLLGMTGIIFLCLGAGCGRVHVRQDIYQNMPVWEGAYFSETHLAGITTHDDAAGKLDSKTAPGLALLAKQVLGRDIDLPAPPSTYHGLHIENDSSARFPVDNRSTSSIPTIKGIGLGLAASRGPTLRSPQQTGLIAADEEPLSPGLAQLPVTQALVRSMVASFESANKIAGEPIQNESLKLGDFKNFVIAIFEQVHKVQTAEASGSNRLKRIQAANENKKIIVDNLFIDYLKAYYAGKFVDRTGGVYSKPKLGLSITNETITAVVRIFMEALMDYAILGTDTMKVPIVFTMDGNKTPVYQTAGASVPTLAVILVRLNPQADLKNDFRPVIEPLQDKGKGITLKKLEYIRFASGLAGDAAQGLTGFTTRLFGGVDIGFAVAGKLSFGDNETLMKVIDTIVELWAKRTTEAFVSTALYKSTIPDNAPLP